MSLKGSRLFLVVAFVLAAAGAGCSPREPRTQEGPPPVAVATAEQKPVPGQVRWLTP